LTIGSKILIQLKMLNLKILHMIQQKHILVETFLLNIVKDVLVLCGWV